MNNNNIVYESKFNILVYVLLICLFYPFSLYYDFKDNNAFFTEWYYYLLPIFVMVVFYFFSLATYSKITIYEIGFVLSSHMIRKRLFFEWEKIVQIEFIFQRFIEVVIKYDAGKNVKKSQYILTHISKKNVQRILYILFVNGINVAASGDISKNWQREAKRVAKSYINKLSLPLS